MKKMLFGAAAVAALVVPAAAMAQAPSSILIVDTDRVLSDCNACRAASTQLQSQGQALQQRAQTLSTQLQTARTPIQTAVNGLQGKQPDAALQARINAFQAQENSAQQEIQSGQQRLQSTQTNVQRQIYAKLGPIIDGILRQRNAQVVLAKNATLASADSLEITNDVLTQLNSQLPSVSVTPLPQESAPAGAQAPAAGTAPAARPAGRRPSGR